MKIKITDDNENKIDKTIADIEGKSHVRCLNYVDVFDVMEITEKMFDDEQINQAARVGTVAKYQDAQGYGRHVGNATLVTIKRGVTDWFLVDVTREQCKGTINDFEQVILTKKGKLEFIKKMFKNRDIV